MEPHRIAVKLYLENPEGLDPEELVPVFHRFIREDLVDEFVVYLAPKIIGLGRGMAHFGPLNDLAHALPLAFQSTALVGPDLRVVARVQGRSPF